VGKALMAKCMEIASESEKDLVWLGVWEQNVRAIRFYSHWGFRKFSEHVFMLGDDRQTDWLMCKPLKDIDLSLENWSV
jgi:ribosomal protein S18 acetylase RimI-like enzyme